jgi:hypothetical protein
MYIVQVDYLYFRLWPVLTPTRGREISLLLDDQMRFALYAASRAVTGLYRPIPDDLGTCDRDDLPRRQIEVAPREHRPPGSVALTSTRSRTASTPRFLHRTHSPT